MMSEDEAIGLIRLGRKSGIELMVGEFLHRSRWS